MSRLTRKIARKAAGKAPAWIVSVAAPDRGTLKQRERHKMAGFLRGQSRAPVRQYSPEEIAAFAMATGPAQVRAA
ncbi:MAG TPA: hypothetical protein DEQ40_09075 [Oxalobacteraceae bacterium]|jgi:hypothetical protein|nr:hypothetical protein [Oxalobacteraceae bacterium]